VNKVTDKERKIFYEAVQKVHLLGASYIESVVYLIEDLGLSYGVVVKLIDGDLKENIKKEAIKRRMITCEDPYDKDIFDLFFQNAKKE
jgi:hypothetical protein